MSKQNDEEIEKPTLVQNTQVTLNAKDTEKAVGIDTSTPTKLDNVKVYVATENVQNATGLKVTAIDKGFALRSKTIVCSCGKVIHSTTTHGYNPIITCPKCGKEYKD
jgi:hypothetical protein